MLAKFWRDFILVQIHVAPVFTPVPIQQIMRGELFRYWFRARGCNLRSTRLFMSVIFLAGHGEICHPHG